MATYGDDYPFIVDQSLPNHHALVYQGFNLIANIIFLLW